MGQAFELRFDYCIRGLCAMRYCLRHAMILL